MLGFDGSKSTSSRVFSGCKMVSFNPFGISASLSGFVITLCCSFLTSSIFSGVISFLIPDAMSVATTLSSVNFEAASLISPFQLVGCISLNMTRSFSADISNWGAIIGYVDPKPGDEYGFPMPYGEL